MSITSWVNEGNGATVTAGNDLSCKTLTTTGVINSGSAQITTSGLMTCGTMAASSLVNATGDLVVEGLTTLKGNVTIGNLGTDTVGFFGVTPVAGNAVGSTITQTYSKFKMPKTIIAEKADISKKVWELVNVKIINYKGEKNKYP